MTTLYRCFNLSAGSCLLSEVEKADTFLSRIKGLLGRDMLRIGQGLWITPCKQIHTFFMAFPIDILFMDKHHTVLAIHRGMAPWRISRIVWRACSVLELDGGTLSQDTHVGHCLEFREQEGLIP